MKDRNPFVLNYDYVQPRPNCRTSQQPAAPVDARHSMTYSTQSPGVTHLYPAAAQPFYRGNANCTPEFNDYGTHVPPRTKKKRIVYGQHNLSATSGPRQHNDNFVQFFGPMTLIDHLKAMIKEVHEMDPNYSESEGNEQCRAHPSWAMNLNYSELIDENERSTSSPIDLKPDSTTSCQTPRECQTRSTAILKKTSMIQQSTLNASAKQLQSELDLPQAGSEDEDETWLAEFAGSQDKAETTAAEAGNTKEATFHPTPKILSVADPDLPRITVPVVTTTSAAPCSTIGHGCDLPGPQSQDDDEDSSPIVQELDRAEHTQCSSYHPPLTHSLGASAHGSEKLPQVTPASPPTNANLSGNFGKKEEENAKLTLTPMRRNSISLVNEH